MAVPRIVELATQIAANTSRFSDYLMVNNVPQPAFDLEALPSGSLPNGAPADIVALRQSILEDTAELRHLMLGPRDYLFSFVVSPSSPASLCFDMLDLTLHDLA